MTTAAHAALLAAAVDAAPAECCGLLLGECVAGVERVTEVRAAANVADDRLSRFEIDPAALLTAHRAARASGPAVIGYYHSHPRGAAAPSAMDRASAAGDGRIWAIVAAGQVGLWRDGQDACSGGGAFVALSYLLVDR